MHNDFINNVKTLFIITIHTITPAVGKHYKDSDYVHVSDLSLNVFKLICYVKSGSP